MSSGRLSAFQQIRKTLTRRFFGISTTVDQSAWDHAVLASSRLPAGLYLCLAAHSREWVYLSWLGIVGGAPELVVGWCVAPLSRVAFSARGEAAQGSKVPLRMGEDIFAAPGMAGDMPASGEADDDDNQRRDDNGGFEVVGCMPATGSLLDRAILAPNASIGSLSSR